MKIKCQMVNLCPETDSYDRSHPYQRTFGRPCGGEGKRGRSGLCEVVGVGHPLEPFTVEGEHDASVARDLTTASDLSLRNNC